MAYLWIALAVVTTICLLNLLLIFGMIRRLREHTALLSKMPTGPTATDLILPAGAQIGSFSAVTTTGETVSTASFADGTLVGFFSPGCAPCRERLPEFVAYAGELGGRDRVFAVVVADVAAEATATVEQLSDVARVVLEQDEGPVAAAFGVKGFPAVGLVSADGTMVASGSMLSGLPRPAAV
ncbi:redoxin domain-containing protein [Catellatospora sp. NPDC049111]|uniref:TlpA family protein disulfide reductase n=1 Tax=Catellatospora sp. NPDC049111 TaxID=3155271 RepID=UPI0033CB2979